MKSVIGGIISSIFVNIMYVFTLYCEYQSWMNYCIPIIIAIIVIITFNKQNFIKLINSIVEFMLGDIFMEVVLFCLGVTNYFYFKVNSDAEEIDIGQGIIMLANYFWECVGILIGILLISLILLTNNIKR